MQRILAILLAAAAVSAGYGTPAAADTTAAQVIDTLKLTEGLVRSASGTTVVVTHDRGPAISGAGSAGPIGITRRYTWAFQVPVWRHEACSNSGADTGPCVYEGYHNGSWTLYDPVSKAMQVYGPACRGRVGVLPLWAQYVGLAFLLDDRFSCMSAKVQAANPIVTGQELIGSETAVTLQGTSPQGQTAKWWLYPAYGYLPARIEERWTCAGGDCRQVLVVTTYSDYTQVAEGIWLPKAGSVTKTVTENDGSTTQDRKVETRSDFTTVNTALASDQLSIIPAAGTTVVHTESIKTAP